MIFSAFSRAIGQLTDPRVLKVLLLSLFGASAVVIALITLGIFIVGGLFSLWDSYNGITLPWIGSAPWLAVVGQSGTALGLLVVGMLLFFPLVAAVTSFFYEEVVDAVETRHYAQLSHPAAATFWASLAESIRFTLLVIVGNIGALILSLIFPPIGTVIFWALNSYLIGREMFFIAAQRRENKAESNRLWRRNLPLLWGVAAVLYLPMTVPILNFVALVIAVGVFTHLYHSLKA